MNYKGKYQLKLEIMRPKIVLQTKYPGTLFNEIRYHSYRNSAKCLQDDTYKKSNLMQLLSDSDSEMNNNEVKSRWCRNLI